MAKNIIAVFGGVSNENEISVITGTMACNILAYGGKEVLPVYISQRGEFYAGEELKDIQTYNLNGFEKCPRAVIANGGVYILSRRGKIKKFVKADCVLNCCHGGFGEGGGLSGICAAAGLPLAGAGIFESSAFLDKYLSKIVLKGLGVKTVPYFCVRQGGELPKKITYPVIVKPVSLGSSIGIQKAENEGELQNALACAFEYDVAAIAERFIEPRREINCAAYFADGEICVSECEEAVSEGEILSFEDKYQGGGRSVIPAEIPQEVSKKIRDITRSVYEKLNMRGIVRFDFIYSDEIYLSEINTVPGSLAYYLFSENFKDFYSVLDSVITQAERDFIASRKTLLSTGILQNIPIGSLKTK